MDAPRVHQAPTELRRNALAVAIRFALQFPGARQSQEDLADAVA